MSKAAPQGWCADHCRHAATAAVMRVLILSYTCCVVDVDPLIASDETNDFRLVIELHFSIALCICTLSDHVQ